jgi:hypothetical protein
MNLLKVPRRLDQIVDFKYCIPLHNSQTPLNEGVARLVVGKDGSDYNTDVGTTSMWSLDVVLKATSVEMVEEWLQHGTQPCAGPHRIWVLTSCAG